MPTALIPADGHWHTLPKQPVFHIDAPTQAQIDILPDGRGQVRFPDWDGELVPVSYSLAGEKR